MSAAAALALAVIALLVGAALGHLSGLRSRKEVADAALRSAELDKSVARLRHDVRGALSPALLAADRLAMSSEPATKRSAEIVVAAIERVSTLLEATRPPNAGSGSAGAVAVTPAAAVKGGQT